jgi:hypothetical protein
VLVVLVLVLVLLQEAGQLLGVFLPLISLPAIAAVVEEATALVEAAALQSPARNSPGAITVLIQR